MWIRDLAAVKVEAYGTNSGKRWDVGGKPMGQRVENGGMGRGDERLVEAKYGGYPHKLSHGLPLDPISFHSGVP